MMKMKKFRNRIHKTDNQGRLFLGQCYKNKECLIVEYVGDNTVIVELKFNKPAKKRVREVEVIQEYQEGITNNLEKD